MAQAAQAACRYVGGGAAEGGGTPKGCPALAVQVSYPHGDRLNNG